MLYLRRRTHFILQSISASSTSRKQTRNSMFVFQDFYMHLRKCMFIFDMILGIFLSLDLRFKKKIKFKQFDPIFGMIRILKTLISIFSMTLDLRANIKYITYYRKYNIILFLLYKYFYYCICSVILSDRIVRRIFV